MRSNLAKLALFCCLMPAGYAQAHSDSQGQWPQQCGISQASLKLCLARKLEHAAQGNAVGSILQYSMNPTEIAEWWIPSGQRECAPTGSFFRLNGGPWTPAVVKCVCTAEDQKIIKSTSGATLFVLGS